MKYHTTSYQNPNKNTSTGREIMQDPGQAHDTRPDAKRSRRTSYPNGHSPSPTGQSVVESTPSIFDEAHECLAQSLLMFLYADLRLLSATGRINTKYETLCIASDRVPRTSAAGLAQLPGMNEFANQRNIESVSPAQIMAILIVELRQEVLAQRKRVKDQIKRREERGWFEQSASDDLDAEDDDAGVMNKITDRKGRKEFETDMHAMIRTYNDMLGRDLKGIPEVKVTFTNPFAKAGLKDVDNTPRRLTLPNLQPIIMLKKGLTGKSNDKPDNVSKTRTPIRNTVSYDEYNPSNSEEMPRRPFSTPAKKLDDLYEEKYEGNMEESDSAELKDTSQPQDNPHRKSVASSDTKPHHSKLFEFFESVRGAKSSQNQDIVDIMSDPGISSRDESSTPDNESSILAHSTQRKRPTLKEQLSVYFERTKEDHALYNKYIIPSEDYNTFAHAEDVGNKIFCGEMTSKRRLSVFDKDAKAGGDGDADRNMNETELLDFMTKCISSRDDSKLSFMKDFFKEDSVSRTMVKSHAKIVWMNDWYTAKDLMYAISVDKQKKRVTVVFRGAITRPDWNHAFDGNLKRIQNPVKDDYKGKSSVIRVHRGFYTYLMRVRKDTGTTKYDEIANKAYEYGSSMIGNDFNVFINGYSLGGGLGVLFGFHASTDERLTRNGPIKIFTYGMPYIASHTFADAFRHQERSKKLQHARIYNSNDIVAHIPFNLRPTRRGSTFVHLGIDVKLYPVHTCSCFGARPPRFHYNDSESPGASYWRALKMNALLNMHFPWKIRDKHGLPELQMRLKRALTESEKANNPMLQKTLDEAYDHLVYRKEKR